MIRNNPTGKETLKQIREREAKLKEALLKDACNAMVYKHFTEEQVIRWSNQNKGLWFLPVMDESGENIEALAVMKPIDRHILSFASTKIEDEGLYVFLEACMRECFIVGINPDQTLITDVKDIDNCVIIADDEYFIPAAMKFNKILESKKAAFLKR